MCKYDLHNLPPDEFERFGMELVSRREGVQYHKTPEGRDSGIDLYHDEEDGSRTIFQCKRYAQKSGLMKCLKDEEVAKVARLDPKRYGLIVSVQLTLRDKGKIKEMFSPYIKTTEDILDLDDICELLDQDGYRQIAFSFPSMWLPSFHLLSRHINNGIYGRTRTIVAEIQGEVDNYVMTDITAKAFDVAEKFGVVMLIGGPGVGKTTSAKMMLADYIAAGHEPVCTFDKIEDFENVYSDDAKQVFLFDDFFGTCYFDVLESNLDKKIIHFINRVRSDAKKRLILTTRTTILNRGVTFSTLLNAKKWNNNPFIVDVGNLSLLEKAKILISRMRKSRLPFSKLQTLCDVSNYSKIIQHPNYNPRMIDCLLGVGEDVLDIPGENLTSYIINKMSSPMDLWDDHFQLQLNETERLTLWLIYLVQEIKEEVLRVAYNKLFSIPCLAPYISGRQDFYRTILVLSKALINRIMYGHGSAVYKLLNNSIGDYLVSRCKHDYQKLPGLVIATGDADLLQRVDKLLEAAGLNRVLQTEYYNLLFNSVDLMRDKRVACRAWIKECCRNPDVNISHIVDQISSSNVILNKSLMSGDLAELICLLCEKGVSLGSLIGVGVAPQAIECWFGKIMSFDVAVRFYKLLCKNGIKISGAISEDLQDSLARKAEEIAEGMDPPESRWLSEDYWGVSDYEYQRMEERLCEQVEEIIAESGAPEGWLDAEKAIEDVDMRDLFPPDACPYPEDYYEESSTGYKGLKDAMDAIAIAECFRKFAAEHSE